MKTETKTAHHTPGPWTPADTGVFAQTINTHGNFYVAALPFPSEEPSEADKANLRLIAAAPDLLAVSERLLYSVNGLNATERACRSGYSASPLYAELVEAIKAASAAIAKAKGAA